MDLCENMHSEEEVPNLNVVVLKLERCVFEMYTLQFALVVMEYALSLMKCATFKEL